MIPMQNALNYAKTIAFNLVLAVALILLIDFIVTGSYFRRHALGIGAVTCDASLTGYDYCPSLVQYLFMDKRDTLMPVYNFIDSERRSTYQSPQAKPRVTKKETVYVIGDSFIQADELPMERRFEHLIRAEGYNVVTYGYSSWNSWQFNRISKQLPIKIGDRVMIFSMTNDYTPSYERSTMETVKNPPRVVNEIRAPPDTTILRDYINQSFFLRRIFPSFSNLVKSLFSNTPGAGRMLNHPNSSNLDDCTSLPNRSEAASHQAYDYLALSKNSACWNSELVGSVDLNLSLLAEAKQVLESKGAKVHIFLVPAGWAFKNQNTIGRKHDLYQFPMGISVSHVGLANYLGTHGLSVKDLTETLGAAIQSDNDLYFAVDGHWTSHAHRTLYQYLSGNILH